jgi:hypothetical protein
MTESIEPELIKNQFKNYKWQNRLQRGARSAGSIFSHALPAKEIQLTGKTQSSA